MSSSAKCPNDFGSLEEFRGIIATPPTWAPDFPIATKARIADRFIESKTAKVETVIEESTICPARATGRYRRDQCRVRQLGHRTNQPRRSCDPTTGRASAGHCHPDCHESTEPEPRTGARLAAMGMTTAIRSGQKPHGATDHPLRLQRRARPAVHAGHPHQRTHLSDPALAGRQMDQRLAAGGDPLSLTRITGRAGNRAGMDQRGRKGRRQCRRARFDRDHQSRRRQGVGSPSWRNGSKDKQLVYILEDNDEPVAGIPARFWRR